MKHTVKLVHIHMTGRNHQVPAFFLDWRNHRISLIILLLFVLFVLSVPKHDITAVIIFAVFPLLLVTAGRLPILLIAKRLLLVSPFIIIMAAANPVLDRTPYVEIGALQLSSGLISGIVIILKSFVTIAAVLAFTLCVPFYRVCDVLHGLHVPDVFVTQLILLYRYSFLLVEEAMSMQKARNMRAFGKKGKDLFTTAQLLGSLLLRTHDKAARIYRSMLARGFDGELKRSKTEKVRSDEITFVISAFIVFGLLRVIF